MESITLSDTERIDDLQFKGLRLIQNTEHFCFGLDAVLLEKNNAAKALDESLDSSLLYLKHILAGSEALDLSGVKRLRTEIDAQLLKFDTSSQKDRKVGK